MHESTFMVTLRVMAHEIELLEHRLNVVVEENLRLRAEMEAMRGKEADEA